MIHDDTPQKRSLNVRIQKYRVLAFVRYVTVILILIRTEQLAGCRTGFDRPAQSPQTNAAQRQTGPFVH